MTGSFRGSLRRNVDAAPSPAFVPDALVGTILGEKYELLSLLGEGGMGAVYLGQHLLMRKRVAVKLLHPDMVGNPEIVARFEREAMAAAHIEHPNIAGATDFGRTPDGAFYLVLEYLEGESLREVLLATPILPEARALRFARQIAHGLVRAHAMGFVHRDLKPENVMVMQREDEPDLVKILDFGIAKLSDGGPVGADGQALSSNQPLTQQGMMYGTPEYMSPEQVRADMVDARADLYALGVMLFEMLAGRRPFEAESRLGLVMAHLEAPVPALRDFAAGVPPALEALVTKLLAKNPDDRVASAKEVSRVLDEAAGFSDPSVTAAHGSPHPPSVHTSEAPASLQTTQPPFAGPASSAVAASASADSPATGTANTVAERSPEGVLASRQPGPAWLASLDRLVLPARARLPGPLRKAPSLLLLGLPLAMLATMGAAGLLVLMTVLARPGTPPPTPEPPAGGLVEAPKNATASDTQLAEAKAGGSAPLGELAKKYPDDRRIWRPLLAALSAERKHPEAMALLAASVGNDPVVASEDAVKQAVLAALEGGPEGMDAAFTAMEGPLGEAGANLLWDLANGKDPKIKDRAWKSLAKPDVKKASPALAAAVELRAAGTCDGKRAALARVKEVGDKRSVSQLKALRQTSGCGLFRRFDCWVCLRGDTLLADAQREAESRPEPGASKQP